MWICIDATGHVQATGRDAKGRTHYLYRRQRRKYRDAAKFHLVPARSSTRSDE